VAGSSEYIQRVSVQLSKKQIAVIRQDYAAIDQTDEQIASGVVVSYLERSFASPHQTIWSWAYASPTGRDDTVRLYLSMTEGQWRRLDDICTAKRIGRAALIRWIIADTAVMAGYPR
jgi:hypothetical protein